MKIKSKSILCTILVVVIILSTLTLASAGATGYFYDKSVNNTSFSYLSGSTKATTSEYGNVRISRVTGGTYALVRAAVPNASAIAYTVAVSSNLNIVIPASFRTADTFVALYGMGQQATYQLTGSWNAN